MDGDEYAGIEAAYALIETYNNRDFSGRLVIVPIVNIPGFEAECSANPIDQKFPKNIYPGKPNGTSTECLMHWLATNYIAKADCWYDMHSGAITEGLQPYLSVQRTGVPGIDDILDKMVASLAADIVVHEKARLGSKSAQLAKRNCMYVMAESGARGSRFIPDIDRHLSWVRTAMETLSMVSVTEVPESPKMILHHVAYSPAPFDGLWRPAEVTEGYVTKGEVLGECCRLDGSGKQSILAACDGERLWWKETMAMRRGDGLYAIGRP